MGFFGYNVQAKGPPQPRWKGTREEPRRAVVDIDEAHEAVRDILKVWRSTSSWPDAPPFSGGVWDSWPQRMAQGLSFLRNEMKAVSAYLQEEASRG